MEISFDNIRKMTSDSRMIALNTSEPQYLISQLKTKLFLNNNTQSDELCQWWIRLYEGNFTIDDKKVLKKYLKNLRATSI